MQHVLIEHYYRAPTPNGVGCVREISSAGVKVDKPPSTVDITMALQQGLPLFRFRFSGS